MDYPTPMAGDNISQQGQHFVTKQPDTQYESYKTVHSHPIYHGRRPSNKPSSDIFIDWQSWWWWWEIMAMVIGIGATSGLIALLFAIDNTALREWPLPIQPNSLIAVLTTINKVALMVPAASCISQLKWQHFANGPRRLADLQLFDAASRGPWGSLVFLSHVSKPFKALVAIGLAFLTIVALGIDASAQQLLFFPLQETEITDASVSMGTATGYISRSISVEYPDQPLNPHLISLQFELLNSLRGSVFESYYTCPQQATRCTWENLTTFGLCSSHDSAQVASTGCDVVTAPAPSSNDNATYAICNYTITNPNSHNVELADAYYPITANLSFRIPAVDSNSGNKVFHSSLVPGPYKTNTEFGEFWGLRAPNVTNFTSLESFVAPAAEVVTASFWWCEKTFQGVAAGPGGVTYNGTSRAGLTELTSSAMGANDYAYTYVAASGDGGSGRNYTLGGVTYEALTLYFNILMNTVAEDLFLPIADGSVLSTGGLLYQQDLGNVTESVEEAVTNVMRSAALGENREVTDVDGRAYFDETYIRVRWPWVVLPVAVTALVAVFFLLSVVVTLREPLLKDSVLAYLSTTVKDDTGRFSEFSMTRWTTRRELDDRAENIVVKLQPDAQGQLGFQRTDYHD